MGVLLHNIWHNKPPFIVLPHHQRPDTETMTTLTADALTTMLADWTLDDGTSVESLAAIDGLAVTDGVARLSLAVDPRQGPKLETMRQLVERKLKDLPDIADASVMLTGKRQAKAAPAKPPVGQGQGRGGNQIIELPGVKHVVAVASGKGGVGKSTVAANLAAAWAQQGFKVGLLDADIYGPSVPTLSGEVATKPTLNANKSLAPVMAHGIKTMSIGYLTDPQKALVWRGPMVQGALVQMLRDVDWGELDVLVLDLPPGTGDVQLTLAQRLKLAGAVIVSTPQDLALIDARRAIEMFERVEVPILGIIENMSVFHCPSCGEPSHIFGHGGAAEEAKARDVAFLGAIPLTMALRQHTDNGEPIISAAAEDPAALAFAEVARQTQVALDATGQQQRKAPEITWL